MSIEQTDREAAAHAVAPRVSLADIEAAIAERINTTGDKAVSLVPVSHSSVIGKLKPLSICILIMRNGFIVIGKSAPASAANFDAELGKKLAYEDAIRQLWPLMGFSLRDQLTAIDANARQS